ncbi:MAG: hypothetical protein HWD59_10905 [Coxiellaceae bacterium]|nr:MAG: hypothetical protein HWD59_10905 [Coxiellaceae bacterium]
MACFQLRDFRKYLKERMSVRGWRIINSCFEVTNGVADFDGSWQNLLPLIGIYKANPDPQSAMFTRYVLMLSYGILNGIIEYNNPQFLEHWRDHQEEFLVAGAAFLADVMFQMTETTVEADLITNVLYLLLFMLTLSSTLVFTVKPTPQNRVEEVTDDPGTSVVIERDMTNVTGNPYMQRQFLQDLQPATTTEQDYSFN